MKVRVICPLSQNYALKEQLKGSKSVESELILEQSSEEIFKDFEDDNALNFLVDCVIKGDGKSAYISKKGTEDEYLTIDFRHIEHNFSITFKDLKSLDMTWENVNRIAENGINSTSQKGYCFDDKISIEDAVRMFIKLKKEEVLTKKNFEIEKNKYIDNVIKFKEENSKEIAEKENKIKMECEAEKRREELAKKNKEFSRKISIFFDALMKDIGFILICAYMLGRIFLTGVVFETMFNIDYFINTNCWLFFGGAIVDVIIISLLSLWTYKDNFAFELPTIGALATTIGQLIIESVFISMLG